MKTLNFKSIAIIMIAGLTFFSSCKDDDGLGPNDPNKPDEVNGNFFSCTLDGADYVCPELFSYFVHDELDSELIAYGVQSTGATVYIAMPDNITTGTRAFSEDIYAYVSMDNKAWATVFGEAKGTLTITKKTDLILEGTFNFIAYDSDDFVTEMIVEEGRFNVEFR